jgi:serine/threonine protein kinase
MTASNVKRFFDKVDIWASGVVLYNMITGKLPFDFSLDLDISELHQQILFRDVEIPQDLPEILIKLLKGLTKFPV